MENSEKIPARSGIYEIQGKIPADGGFTRRYVGTAKNLKQKYLEHLSREERNEQLKSFLKEKKTFFRYLTSEAEGVREDIEKGLYDKYKHRFRTSDKMPVGSGKYSKIEIIEANP